MAPRNSLSSSRTLSAAGNRNGQEPQSQAHTASRLAVLPPDSVRHRAQATLPDCLAETLFIQKRQDTCALSKTKELSLIIFSALKI